MDVLTDTLLVAMLGSTWHPCETPLQLTAVIMILKSISIGMAIITIHHNRHHLIAFNREWSIVH